MSNMEEQFVRLNARTSSVLQTLNEDSVDHQALVGVGPLFRSEAPAPAAAAPRKRSGNKPARNFVLVNSVEQNGVKIKFETSMDGLAMNAIIKRQFPELQSARNIIYHKARSAGNHALYKVGTDLAGSEVVANFKTPTTRVYVGPPDNIQAQEEVQVHFVSDEDVSAGGNEPPVHVAVTQGTPSPVMHSFTGKFGPQFHEVCFPGSVSLKVADKSLFYPGLLHADRTRCLATLNSASVCSGVPFVGISFKALCHHIKTAIKLGVVVILNVADKLSATERNLLCDLNTATITSDWDTQCLFWVSSSESGEACFFATNRFFRRIPHLT